MQELQTLLHADEAKPTVCLSAFQIKADARIADGEVNLIWCSPQSHFEVPHSTVFRRVVQSFLQNSKKAK